MNCPVCKDSRLVLSERQGIEIDYCPQCRGVWLDRGELDKIIDRSTSDSSTHSFSDDRHRKDEPYRREHKRKESFLGELFDF